MESIEWIARQGLVTWKRRQSAKENPKGGYNCSESGSGRPRSARSTRSSTGRTSCSVRRTRQKGIGQLVRFRMKLSFSFKCIRKNNSPWSPAHMLQTMSCSAVVWSQSYLPSHSLMNNLIVCKKILLLLWTPAQRSLSEVHVMFCECYFLFLVMAALCSGPG